MKVLLAGNCQMVGMGAVLAASFPELQVEAWEVWNKTAEELQELSRRVEAADVVIAHPAHDKRYAGVMKAYRARPGSRRSVLIHNLHWEGVFPDSRYVGKPAIASPIMTYHSGKVVQAFRNGRSEAEALDLLTHYSKVEIAAAWERSHAEFLRREKDVDVRFLAEMVDSIRSYSSFHVFNHPTIALISRYAAKIAVHLGFGAGKPAVEVHDRLAPMGSFQIAEDVRAYFGLPYAAPHFTAKTPDGVVIKTTETFVAESYAIYNRVGRERLV